MDRHTEHARELYDSAIVVNMHNSSTMNDLEDTWQSGVTCTGVTPAAISEDFRLTIEKMFGTNDTSILEVLRRAGDNVFIALSAGDIERAKAEGKVSIMIGFQNADPLDQDLNFVDLFHQIGVRFIAPTYNRRNHYGSGCAELTDCGLSELGVDLVRKLNRKRIMIDLSHVGRQTCLDVLELSDSPVIFSHSNARAVCDSYRNVDDEVLRRLADKEGVIGLTAFPSFVRRENPTLAHLVDHMDHITELIGVDHVGIGLDLIEGYPSSRFVKADGSFKTGKLITRSTLRLPWPWVFPDGIGKRSQLPNLVRELIVRGYTDSQVLAILGTNFLRVMRQVFGESN
jgi:membrane dipeptidase